MKYDLMHRKIRVAQLEIDEATGIIQGISDVYEKEHMPLGTMTKDGTSDYRKLNVWWLDRMIPSKREGLNEILEQCEIGLSMRLLLYSNGLSLSDQYWICPSQVKLNWENVNFFDNAFSKDFGDMLFDCYDKNHTIDFASPDITTKGVLQKRWNMAGKQRYLVKGATNPFRQQPLNEKIATEIMECMDIPHVPYQLMWDGNTPYSVCENFITRDTELIPAWQILKMEDRDYQLSPYHQFIQNCNKLGIPNVLNDLERMIVLDYLIANEDRHWNNFGVLRNAKTLDWIGMAPIYDCGNSLGYNKLAHSIRSGKDIVCKPFAMSHVEQIKMVTSFDWISQDVLCDASEIVWDVLSEQGRHGYTDEDRNNAIVESVVRRTQTLCQMMGVEENQSAETEIALTHL